jgi:sporulation protein YqfC
MAKKFEKKRGETVSLRERICQRLDLVPDCLPGECMVELRGRHAVTVSGGGKILLYTPEEIRIAIKRGAVRVTGERLVCTSYYVGAVGIEGLIIGVFFEEGE